MIFTNSADQLRAALNRNVDKEMAVEALYQSPNSDTFSQEGERLGSSLEVATAKSLDDSMTNSREDNHGEGPAAEEETELALDS